MVDTGAQISVASDNEKLLGQGSPAYAFPEKIKLEWDNLLLDALVAAIRDRNPVAPARRSRLLRSLEFAALAMRAPLWAHDTDTLSESGVGLSLWVSAFETLANPGSNVKFTTVATLIDSVPWVDKRLRRRTVIHDYRSANRVQASSTAPTGNRITKPVQVYSRLYRARNLTLHGEDWPRGGLEPNRNRSWGPLAGQAAALYRSVLLYSLDGAGYGLFPRRSGARIRSADIDVVVDYAVANRAHEVYEEALVHDYNDQW